jgi:hypothetical protein
MTLDEQRAGDSAACPQLVLNLNLNQTTPK